MKTFWDFTDELNELSTNTLGRYASKALQRSDIATSSGAEKHGEKRSKGAQLAVKKMGQKTGDKSTATRTSNKIAKNTDLAKKWRADKSVDRNKTYQSAAKGINKLRGKA